MGRFGVVVLLGAVVANDVRAATAEAVVKLALDEGVGSSSADSGAGALADNAVLHSATWGSDGSGTHLLLTPASRSHVELPASAEVDPSFKFTWTFWLKPDGWTEGQIVLYRAGAKRPAYLLRYRHQWLWLEIDGHVLHARPPEAGRWTQVAVAFDGERFRLHYDGALQNDSVERLVLPAPTGPLLLGTADPAGPVTGFYAGGLADFRIYDRALTELELHQRLGLNMPPTATPMTRNVVQDQPLALVLGGADPEGALLSYELLEMPVQGVLAGTAPQLTYTPASGYTGADSFRFRVFDGSRWSEPATVALSVRSNTLPVAQNIDLVINEDAAVAVNLTGLNLGTSPTYEITRDLVWGAFSGTGAQRTYRPKPNYANVTESVTYTITDGQGVSLPGTITITIRPVNDAPTAAARTFVVRAAAATDIKLPITDPDDEEWLRYTITRAPAHGTLSGRPPYLTYTAAPGYTGADSFDFTVTDEVNPTASTTVTLDVRALATHNVRAYGATGDGVTDDTLAIRAALAAAEQAGGGTIYFPAGTYAVGPQAADPEWISSVQPGIFDVSGSNIEFVGDGAQQSIISAYTRGPDGNLANPMTTWTSTTDDYFKIKRGGAFRLTNRRVGEWSNITFRGLRITGNTTATGNHSVGGDRTTGDGWDMSHKAISLAGGIGDNVLIEDCILDGWRGEVVYAGIIMDRLTIRRAVIHDSNASALSASARVWCEDVEIYDCYNGVENYAQGYPQQSTFLRCTIEPNRRLAPISAGFGVVYLGRVSSRLTVEDSVIKNCPQSGIFLSDFAYNVVVRGCTFTDAGNSLYFIRLGLYAAEGYDGFEGVLFQENITESIARSGYGVIIGGTGRGARFWTVRDNTTRATAPAFVDHMNNETFAARPELRRNYYMLDNTVAANRPSPYYNTFRRPLWYGNTLVGSTTSGDHLNGPLPSAPVTPGWERFTVNVISPSGGALHFDPQPLPEGFEFEVVANDKTVGVELPPAAWNNFGRGYMVYKDVALRLRVGADGRIGVKSYLPPAGSRLVSSGAVIDARGYESVTLAAGTYSDHAGIGQNAVISLTVRAGATLARSARLSPPGDQTLTLAQQTTFAAIRLGDTLCVFTPPTPQASYSAWRQARLANASPAAAIETADADGDGASNLLEYALDLDPLAAASRPLLTRPESGLALSFLRARAELTYTVEASTDLVTWTMVATNPGTVGMMVSVPAPAGATPQSFLRLRVTTP